jgi:hypothetical protein
MSKTISASTDNGDTWTEYTSTIGGGTMITTLNNGEKLLIKGTNAQYANSASQYNNFLVNGNFIIYGNIMSLIYGDNFAGQTAFTEASPFMRLFYGSYNLASAENLILPATTLTSGCYRQMFYGCTSLTTAPELPATTLVDSCYYHMFYGCTSLTTAPELPATTLEIGCYNSMFRDCTSLTVAPELPATTLVLNCYNSMFWGCTSLTKAPELPATTLVGSCYRNMFYGCTNLNYIKCLATDISANNCTTSWVGGVASTGTFVKAASMSSWITGSNNGIPYRWTVVDA